MIISLFFWIVFLCFIGVEGYICYLCPVQWLTGTCLYLLLCVLLEMWRKNKDASSNETR